MPQSALLGATTALVIAAVVIAIYLSIALRTARGRATALEARLAPILDVEAEKGRVLQELADQRAEIEREHAALRAQLEQRERDLVRAESAAIEQSHALRTNAEAEQRAARSALAELEQQIAGARAELLVVSEELLLHSVGLYTPRFALSSALEYELRLERLRQQQKTMVKSGTAAVCSTPWIVEGSAAKGRKMVAEQLKLMLRAFNGECDAAVARVSYRNHHVMIARMRKAWEAINALGASKNCEIVREYLQVKLDELDLAHEYEQKLQAEKEEQRQIRERMREEEQAQRELERARQDAEKEEQRYADALRRARENVERAVGAKQEQLLKQIAELEARLEEAHEKAQRAISRAQLTRSGHVYVISNIGSFGEHIYKIGMTRRLDPMERIRELGDASVPFQFDIHAVIYSEDAPGLEAKLHRRFADRRVNRVNERKEFFCVTIDEIAAVVEAEHDELRITKLAEAIEFRRTLAILQEELRLSRPGGTELPIERSLRVPPAWQPSLLAAPDSIRHALVQ